MDDSNYYSRTLNFPIYGNKEIEVVYTNDPAEVQRVVDMYQGWLKEEEHKFVGLDMEYTWGRMDDKRMAVIQLGLRRHVLVFHCAWYENQIPSIFLSIH